jgi:hypothetical protein
MERSFLVVNRIKSFRPPRRKHQVAPMLQVQCNGTIAGNEALAHV